MQKQTLLITKNFMTNKNYDVPIEIKIKFIHVSLLLLLHFVYQI